MEIKSLGNVGYEKICKAFGQAFADYEVQLDDRQLKAMWRRRGFDPELSFAAFDNDEIVAFTLNGVGLFNGIPTAYDTGTGTLEAYRGQGLATKIFEYSIPFLKQSGIEQYLLEVLQHNTKAVSVYRKLGFEIVREFDYAMQTNSEVHVSRRAEPQHLLRRIVPEESDSVCGFWDFYPSWQNSMESVGRASGDFICLGAFDGERLVGYAVFDPVSGDVTQLAVGKTDRRKGIASLLLSEMVASNKNEMIKVINTDIYCTSICGFLNAANIPAKGKQFEMIKRL